jgi:hypothetical protein
VLEPLGSHRSVAGAPLANEERALNGTGVPLHNSLGHVDHAAVSRGGAIGGNPGDPDALACTVEISIEQVRSPDYPDDANCPEDIETSSFHEP